MPKILTMDANVKPGTVAHAEHVTALQRAARTGNGRPDFARAMGRMLLGWEEYAAAMQSEFDWKVGDDAVLGPQWQAIGRALRALLDGHMGGFDGGSLWSNITTCAAENGAALEE